MLRVGDELILGGYGYLLNFNIETCEITSTHKFKEVLFINDIIAIDETHFLLAVEAADNGLLKTTKNKLIKHYH